MGKEIATQVQETQRVPERINEVEDRNVEINEAERKEELNEMRTISETSGTM